MSNSNHAIDVLIESAKEYAPSKAGSSARLQDLDLFVDVRQVQALQAGSMAIFISEFNARPRQDQKGLVITQVGRSSDMPSAVTDAVAQWVLGVLPVLAHWRGKHSCFCSSQPIDAVSSQFDLLAGPVVARGHSAEGSQPVADIANLWQPVLDVLRKRRLYQRTHWLELFTSKFNDGSVEATCRWGNHDWTPGKDVLAKLAAGWPMPQELMQSSRQFVMLLPKHGNANDITLPTFWSRLFGRA
jgi:hypothetical protein